MAGTLILEEKRRYEEEGRPRRLKVCVSHSHSCNHLTTFQCGVFFAGWPPIKINKDGEAQCLLADECDDVIDVPTLHIVGCNDPWLNGSLALFALCNDDVAVLFDHGKGHTVPRDAVTTRELARSLNESVKKCQTTVCA